MKAAPVTLALVAALAASPALAQDKETIGDAVVQPLRDLSVIKQKTPPILQKAAEAPYAPAGDCEIMRQEIADLDKVLGEDIGAVNDDGSTLVTSAVKSVVKLPFAGVIRRITGAQKRDAAHEDALVAGVARRAYLKGAMTACTEAPPLVPEMSVTVPVVPEPEKSQVAAVPVVPKAAPTGDARVVVATTP
jgi:hypothetical protein